MPPSTQRRGRYPHACENCRRFKTKCTIQPGEPGCDKCYELELVCSLTQKPATTSLTGPTNNVNHAPNSSGISKGTRNKKSRKASFSSAPSENSQLYLNENEPRYASDVNGMSPDTYPYISGQANGIRSHSNTMHQGPFTNTPPLSAESHAYQFQHLQMQNQSLVDNYKHQQKHVPESKSNDSPNTHSDGSASNYAASWNSPGQTNPTYMPTSWRSPNNERRPSKASSMADSPSGTTPNYTRGASDFPSPHMVTPRPSTAGIQVTGEPSVSSAGTNGNRNYNGNQHSDKNTLDAFMGIEDLQRHIRLTSPLMFMQRTLPPDLLTPEYKKHLEATKNSRDTSKSIIDLGIVTMEQAIKYVSIFKQNYNHWIYLDDSLDDTKLTLSLLYRSNLLVAVCCALALRFEPGDVELSMYKRTAKYIYRNLMMPSLRGIYNIEYLQALVIVANFNETLSTSLWPKSDPRNHEYSGNSSSTEFSPLSINDAEIPDEANEIYFDAWQASAVGIWVTLHIVTITDVTSSQLSMLRRLWNSLVCSHLFSCNSTGRRSAVDLSLFDRNQGLLCNGSLSSQFDACMLAEMSVQLIVQQYTYNEITYEQAISRLDQWTVDWGFLTSQRSIQFADACHHYSRFLVEMRRLIPKGDIPPHNIVRAAFTEASTSAVMCRLRQLTKAPEALLYNVDESYFPYLSDQIHQLGVFSGFFILELCAILWPRSLSTEDQEAVSYACATLQRLIERFKNTAKITGEKSDFHRASLQEMLHRHGFDRS